MSTYLIVEFPSMDAVGSHYRQARDFFHTRASCLSRSETNPLVSFLLLKDDVNIEVYNYYIGMLPETVKTKEVEVI